MKGQIQTDLGQIMIDEEVIAKYAGINALVLFSVIIVFFLFIPNIFPEKQG